MKLIASTVLAAAAIVCLTGCATAASIAVETFAGTPDGLSDSISLLNAEPVAVWGADRAHFSVVTVGSGSCPPVPTSITSPNTATIALVFVQSPNDPCSADLGPTTHEFATPAGIDSASPVTVTVQFDFTTDYNYELTLD